MFFPKEHPSLQTDATDKGIRCPVLPMDTLQYEFGQMPLQLLKTMHPKRGEEKKMQWANLKSNSECSIQ
jgi:hypothetical protein